MNITSIHIRIESDIKKQAQKIADELGLSLSAVMKALLKQFIRSKKIDVSLPKIPNAYFKRTLAKARKDFKAGKGSPIFTNIKDELKWLEKQGI